MVKCRKEIVNVAWYFNLPFLRKYKIILRSFKVLHYVQQQFSYAICEGMNLKVIATALLQQQIFATTAEKIMDLNNRHRKQESEVMKSGSTSSLL